MSALRPGGAGWSHATLLCSSGGKDGSKEEKELPSLDCFLSKNTSEDNASFEQIMALAQDKEKLKNAWLYEAEDEFKQVLKHRLKSLAIYVCVSACVIRAFSFIWCYINKVIIGCCSVERKVWLCHHQRLRLWSVWRLESRRGSTQPKTLSCTTLKARSACNTHTSTQTC